MNDEGQNNGKLPAKNCRTKTPSSKIKVLIISYYWPPAGGPGVQRWLKFVKYFKEFGIEPIVFIPENPHYPIVDESLLNEVPEGITIIKHPIKEPYGFAKVFSKKNTSQISSGVITSKKQSLSEKLMLWVRGNFFIPDARIGWVKPSVAFLQKYILNHKIDVVITTGPPHSLHLIGMQLKEKTGVKWLTDFRDPWTTIHYHKSLKLSNSSEKKHKQLEAEVLNKADCIVVTSSNTKKEFSKLTKKPIEVITNGFEPSKVILPNLDTKFSLAHIGSLLSDRNPKTLWNVLSEICQENIEFKKDLLLKLVGIVGEEILESINVTGLKSNCEFLGYVSHKEALQLQKNAQILLLIEIDSEETKAIIPGKLFEYIAAKRPIIAMGPIGSDVADIIYETNSGEYILYSEKEYLRNKIISHYKMYKQDNLSVTSQNISKYTRKELTSVMSEVIKKIISK